MMRGKKLLLAAVVVVLVLALTTVAIGATRHPSNGLAGQASSTKPATVITGGCKVGKINFATNDAGSATTSTTFATIPGMSVTFVIGGTTATCVTAVYSGQVFAASGGLLNIEAVLDGVTVAGPGEVQLAGDTDENANGQWSRSYSMQFAFPAVAPGTHTVSILWRSFFGTSVFINKGSMIVQHK